MSLLSQEVIKLIQDKSAIKILATLDEHGTPYPVASTFFQHGKKGLLVHLELLEKSTTNRNLLRSLWFDKKVSVSVSSPSGRSVVVTGRPVKAHICGPIFRHYYRQVQSVIADADLATVWLIEPDEVFDETYSSRKELEEEQFPFTVHLDRLTV